MLNTVCAIMFFKCGRRKNFATCICCAHFLSLRSLQNAVHDLARVNIKIRLGFGLCLRLELGLGLGLKFANCACAVLTFHIAHFANCAD